MHKDAIARQVDHYVMLARGFGYTVPPITVLYNLRGRAAGQARQRNGKYFVRFNMEAYTKDPDRMLNQTVPHEVAHIIQFANWGKTKPHGREWREVMIKFGVSPERCHSLGLTKARTVARNFPYRCNCGTKMFTSIRHRRSQKWLLDPRSAKRPQYYSCRTCKQFLVYSP